jgi:hypothetical protein
MALYPIRVILINGPDRSGKDTLAEIIGASLRKQGETVHTVRLADPLKAAAAALYRLREDCVKDEDKETPLAEFDGKRPREVWASLAESCIKPNWGADFFAKRAARAITLSAQAEGTPVVFIVPDVRFIAEMGPLTSIPRSSSLLIRLASPGTEFIRWGETYQDIEGTRGGFFLTREGQQYRALRALRCADEENPPTMRLEFTVEDVRG